MPVTLADVEAQFQKDASLKKDDLRILKEWLEKQPHLPKIDDLRLVVFLHCNLYNIEKAKNQIENFYTARAHAPELFQEKNVNDKELKQQAELMCMSSLPKEGNGNRYEDQIMFFRIADPNADLFQFNPMVKVVEMSVRLYQLQQGITPGHVLILDSEGLTLSHVMKVNLATTKKLAYYVQDCYPHRLKAVHIINVSAITEKLFVFVKPFIRKEYVDKIHFHPKIESLYNHVPKDIMPSEYGGKGPSWKDLQAAFKQNISSNQEFFDLENVEFTDETKRVGKPKTMADVYGVEGTFKKLEVD